MNTNFLENLQNDVERYLNTRPIFRETPVLSHKEGNLESSINEFIQAGIGLCVVVLNPMPIQLIPTESSVAFEEVSMRIQVIENPCSGLKSLNALKAAEAVSQNLHNFKPALEGWQGWISLQTHTPWKEIKDPFNLGRYILELSFYARGSILPKKEKANS